MQSQPVSNQSISDSHEIRNFFLIETLCFTKLLKNIDPFETSLWVYHNHFDLSFKKARFSRTPLNDRSWWSRTESNRWHSACKADALPTELRPRLFCLVGQEGFEPSTPALSRRCSNRLSYWPSTPNSDNKPISVSIAIECKTFL